MLELTEATSNFEAISVRRASNRWSRLAAFAPWLDRRKPRVLMRSPAARAQHLRRARALAELFVEDHPEL
jgi:hypothetical protein